MRFDLSEKVFGTLTVICVADRTRYWVCRCTCGNIKEIRSNHLTMGKTKSCGECRIFTLPGKTFGKLKVLEFASSSQQKPQRLRFLCECTCGKQITTTATLLIHGRSTSCGRCIDKSSRLGKTFGYLTVLSWNHITFKGNSYWNCRCVCGQETITSSSGLNKERPSCGCKIYREKSKQGEKSGVNILKKTEVQMIRYHWGRELLQRKLLGKRKVKYSMQDLASKYGVSYSCINHVIYSVSWSSVSPTSIPIEPVENEIL